MVLVEDGTYTSGTCTAGENSGQALVNVNRSGTSSNYITFKSQNKWGAVLDGKGVSPTSGCAEGWRIAGSYIRIQDFEMRGFLDDAVDNYQGGGNLDIIGNHIHDIGRYCTTTGIGRDGIFLGGSNNGNITVEQNTINDIGRYISGENGCITTDLWRHSDHGMYIEAGTGFNIKNNIFYRCERGWAIHNYPSSATSLYILNNTFVYNYPLGANEPGSIILAGGGNADLRIENNVAYGVYQNFIRFYSTSGYSASTVANNITQNGTVSDIQPSGVTFSGNINNTDPLITSAGSMTMGSSSIPDAHEQSGSPGIDGGLNLSPLVTNDYAGVSRPQGAGYDIGAFEFLTGTGSSTLNPPSNLTVTVR
jgi:hypothetical protein